VNFGPVSPSHGVMFESIYLAHFLLERDEIWQRWGCSRLTLIPEFGELWSRGSAIPCGDIHQPFTDALVASLNI